MKKRWLCLFLSLLLLLTFFASCTNSRATVGEKSADGQSGVGVASAEIDEEGNLILKMTDGSVLNAGKLPSGEKGEKGDQGNNGITPHIGKNGNWWVGDTDTGVNASGGESAQTLSDEEYYAGFTPIVRFAVASDVHINGSVNPPDERLAKLFTDCYAKADADSVYDKLDAVMLAGDITNDGQRSNMEKVNGIVNGVIREDTERLFVMGNHDYMTGAATAEKDFTEVFGLPKRFHTVINGLHFIGISPSVSGGHFSDDDIAFLENALEEAEEDNPYMPIFVVQHQNISGTIFGSSGWGIGDLTSVLSCYPQVIDFSGHSHCPIENPRSIYQKAFTCLGTGTLKRFEIGLTGVSECKVYPYGTEGEYSLSTATAYYDGANYYIVEVDAAGAVRIIGMDLLTDKEICRYYIRTPWNTKSFRYTDKRENTAALPVMPESGATVSDIMTGTATLRFPQATIAEDVVESYRAYVYAGEKLIATQYAISCYFYDPMPETLKITLKGLPGDTDITVKIKAVNAYGKESENELVVNFHSAEPPTPETPPAPDVFSAVFNESGATDTISGTALGKIGTPTTKATGNDYVGVFDGSSGFTYNGIGSYYNSLKQSFTLETYCKITAVKDKYGDPFSNQQSGGFGFDVFATGNVANSTYITNGYYSVNCSYCFDEYVHLVSTYDGHTLCLYINGLLVGTREIEGSVKFPSSPADYLVIGGDSGNSVGALDAPITGEVAVANVYSRPMTEGEVYGRYLQLTGQTA